MKCVKSKHHNLFRPEHHYDIRYLLGTEGIGYMVEDEFGRVWFVRESDGGFYIFSSGEIMAEFVK